MCAEAGKTQGEWRCAGPQTPKPAFSDASLFDRTAIRVFREAFDLYGTPVALELRSSSNPYQGRKNRLTPRQERKRKRLMRKVKKR